MEYKSLLNKYKIFENIPNEKECDEVIGMFNGKPITKGIDWVVRLVGNFEGLSSLKEIEEHYDLDFELLKNCTLGDIHVFRIDEDILGLVTKTDSSIEYTHSPFPKIFIDGEVKIDDNIKLYGLFIKDFNKNSDILYSEKDLPNNLVLEGMIRINFRNREFIMPYFNVIGIGKGIIYDKEFKYVPKYINEKIKKFVCSFLNFVIHPDIEIMPYHYDERERKKQQQKGKVVKSSLQTIKVTGRTRIYIENLKGMFGGKIDWTHSFWVRGHFVKFQHERYKNAKGKIIWKMPFIKGKGILIKKEYEIKKR